MLERAITHRSFSADHNERLEFLGDSVLNLAVAHLLFEQLRDASIQADLIDDKIVFTASREYNAVDGNGIIQIGDTNA